MCSGGEKEEGADPSSEGEGEMVLEGSMECQRALREGRLLTHQQAFPETIRQAFLLQDLFAGHLHWPLSAHVSIGFVYRSYFINGQI